METAGKIFVSHSNDFLQCSSNYVPNIYKNIVVFPYDYEKSNSYSKLLNEASSVGLRQLIITPYRFEKLIKNISSTESKIRKLEFDPPLNEEDQEYLNSLLHYLNTDNLLKLYNEINYLDKECDAIPFKISLYIENGHSCSIYNNGVVFVQDKNDYNEITPLIANMLEEVR